MCEFAKPYKVVTKTLDMVTQRVVKYMKGKGLTLSVAESCTGGMLSERITAVSGASEIYKGGVCSYSEEIKQRVLGVKAQTLSEFSVYSPQVASQMSQGVMELMGTDASVGITGIAGPSGGSDEKPVGTVYVSVRFRDMEKVRDLRLYKEYERLDRESVRTLAAQKSLEMLLELINESEA